MADPNNPPTAPGIRARIMDANAYEAELREKVVNPALAALEDQVRAAGTHYAAIAAAIRQLPYHPDVMNAPTEAAARAHYARLKAWHTAKFRRIMRSRLGLRVGPLDDFHVDEWILLQLRTNVDLVKTIPTRLHAKLYADILELADDAPFDQARLSGVLRKGYQSAGFNLRRLTRDQTNKAIGQFNRLRQTQVGIEEYIWSTSMDERVRPTHQSLEGMRFRWDAPPAEGHPGTPILCRCVARPIVPRPDFASRRRS